VILSQEAVIAPLFFSPVGSPALQAELPPTAQGTQRVQPKRADAGSTRPDYLMPKKILRGESCKTGPLRSHFGFISVTDSLSWFTSSKRGAALFPWTRPEGETAFHRNAE
jgi:hypothetical protein